MVASQNKWGTWTVGGTFLTKNTTFQVGESMELCVFGSNMFIVPNL